MYSQLIKWLLRILHAIQGVRHSLLLTVASMTSKDNMFTLHETSINLGKLSMDVYSNPAFIPNNSKCIGGSSHYLGDKQDFDVSSKGPSSGN